MNDNIDYDPETGHLVLHNVASVSAITSVGMMLMRWFNVYAKSHPAAVPLVYQIDQMYLVHKGNKCATYLKFPFNVAPRRVPDLVTIPPTKKVDPAVYLARGVREVWVVSSLEAPIRLQLTMHRAEGLSIKYDQGQPMHESSVVPGFVFSSELPPLTFWQRIRRWFQR